MIQIKVTGAQKIIDKLNSGKKAATQGVNVALGEFGIILSEEIVNSIDGQRAEPRSVDTGFFRSSINYELGNLNLKVSSDADYSRFLEFGTSHIYERRHFRNSMARTSPILKSKIKEQFKELTN